MNFNHSTQQDLTNALRERYRSAQGDEAARIAAYLRARPNAELEAAFGVTGTELTALKNRLSTASNRLTQLRTLRGE